MRSVASVLAFSSLLFLAAGCGDGLHRAAVNGQVLVDKEPLEEGAIEFFPVDGTQGPAVGAIVKSGKYAIPAGRGVIVGSNKVVIRGFKKSGKKIADIWEKGKMIDEMIAAVPPEFNDNSTLTRTIAAGNNTFDFDLPGIKK